MSGSERPDPRSPSFYDRSYYEDRMEARHWFRDNKKKHETRILAVLDAIDADADTLLLDLGCANGRHTRVLAENAGSVVGVDFSPAAIDTCRRLHAEVRNLSFVEANAENLTGFADDSFNVVTAIDFFEHVEDATLGRIISEVRRVLRPGGMLVFYTPCGSHYVERMKSAGIFLKQLPGHIAVRPGEAYPPFFDERLWNEIRIRYLPSSYPFFGWLDAALIRVPLLGRVFRFRAVGRVRKI